MFSSPHKKTILIVAYAGLFLSTSVCTSKELPPDLRIFVDPRIELLAVVQSLGDYGERLGLINTMASSYKKDVEDHFAPFKDHPAIGLFSEMSKVGFSYDAPPATMIHLSNPPELKKTRPISKETIRRAGGEEKLDAFLVQLRDFAVLSNFMEFFSGHQDEFQELAETAMAHFGGINPVKSLEEYYGVKQKSYNIVLAPLFRGNYGPRLEHEDGRFDVFNIVSPIRLYDGTPHFGAADYFEFLAWHEFSHSFINPLTEKNRDEVMKYSSLYAPIAEKMTSQAYGNWITTVNEHIVRAVTTRLNAHSKGAEYGERVLEAERSRGFFYVPDLCAKLEEYEANRKKYPVLADFYPLLIDVFRQLEEKELGPEFYLLPFTGTINAVTANKTNVLLVIPTAEKDQESQTKIREYVAEIMGMFYKESSLVTDVIALDRDLSTYSVVAYGTVEGNLLIKKLIADIPVRMEPDKITIGEVFEGENLRFITAWPNPYNPVRGILIYTALDAADIPGINSVFHGPTDYVVASGNDVLKAEDYKKSDGRWVMK